METVAVDVYSDQSNAAVLTAPGRHCPGILVQGDSLSILCDLAEEVIVGVRTSSAHEDTVAAAEELRDLLLERVLHYQNVLDQHGIQLPFLVRHQPTTNEQTREAACSTITEWVFEENLRPFIQSLGWAIPCAFDDDDWDAVRVGVATTDAEANRWYSYELQSAEPTRAVRFKVARDVGSSVVAVQLELPAGLAPVVASAITIFQTFRLT